MMKNSLLAIILILAAPICAGTDKAQADLTALGNQAGRYYIESARQRFADALHDAELLLEQVNQFVESPDGEKHARVKQAWLQAHKAYSLTEVFRFGNPNVDAWEAKVNAWPVDEGFIDYVTGAYHFDEGNPHARENIIAQHYVIDDQFLEAARGGDMAKEYAASFQFTVSEANVATGFHAIEFLLWGQDHNQQPLSSGQRSYTDYLTGDDCTHENCQRRAAYLLTSARILVRDLQFMLNDWQLGEQFGNTYANQFIQLPVVEKVQRMLLGMGTLSYGELAGERMRTALIANDQEEEQSCFSDTTHWSIYQNALAVQWLYQGEPSVTAGQAVVTLSDLIARLNPQLDARLREQLAQTMQQAKRLVEVAEQGEPFDQMILADNTAGRERIEQLIESLKQQTITIEQIQGITAALGHT